LLEKFARHQVVLVVHPQDAFAQKLIVLSSFVNEPLLHSLNVVQSKFVFFDSHIPERPVDQSLVCKFITIFKYLQQITQFLDAFLGLFLCQIYDTFREIFQQCKSSTLEVVVKCTR
jgi:hypothetical protein